MLFCHHMLYLCFCLMFHLNKKTNPWTSSTWGAVVNRMRWMPMSARTQPQQILSIKSECASITDVFRSANITPTFESSLLVIYTFLNLKRDFGFLGRCTSHFGLLFGSSKLLHSYLIKGIVSSEY